MADEEIRVPIRSGQDIVAARQHGRSLAIALDFSRADATFVATAITELAGNIVKYARSGEIRLKAIQGSARRGLQVTAHDEGPGIADVKQALRDGFSTSGSLGLGLPGVMRLMDDFQIDSAESRGTTVTVRKWQAASPGRERRAARQAAPHQASDRGLQMARPIPARARPAGAGQAGAGRISRRPAGRRPRRASRGRP